jgi:hypothetical protein
VPIISGLITLLAVAGFSGIGWLLIRRWSDLLDPALALAVSGMVGLALVGWISLPIGLLPGGVRAGVYVIAVIALLGWVALLKFRPPLRASIPSGPTALIPVGLILSGLVVFVCACGPSDLFDWDSLAYHLAAPKMWIQQGQISNIWFIHQSNFPFMVDNLYLWGLQWGGQAGAKSFMAAFYGLGLLACFGAVRGRYGAAAGWWSALAFAGIPVVLWESGTAYIDAAQGLYAAIGLWLLAEWYQDQDRIPLLWLGAGLLGCSAASKYTGLQVVFAAGVVMAVALLLAKRSRPMVQASLAIAVMGIALPLPWLAKNAAWYGNPLYPFFYERLGGQNWSDFQAEIYRNEQQTFGVGRTEKGRDPLAAGHAILGLSYQPGRYVNPAQTEGGGFPTGSIGAAALLGGLALLVGGRLKRNEAVLLAILGLGFLMWFVLSQQSRYLTILAIPLAMLAGVATQRLPLKGLIAAVVALQFVYSLGLVWSESFVPKAPLAFGVSSMEAFERERVGPIADHARNYFNQLPKSSKVALYDEVFGYFLDVPYFWANPGHSSIIPYRAMETGEDFEREMRKLGFTHVYLSLRFQPPAEREKWLGMAGLAPVGGYTPEEKMAMMVNQELRWKALLAEAVAQGRLRLVRNSGSSAFVFEFSSGE